MVAGDAFPASPSLKDVARFYLKRLPAPQRAQLFEHGGRTLRVGTLCSGTDSPIPVLKNLAKAVGGNIQVEHTFSCEFDQKKREWIMDNFPDLPHLFGDVTELQNGAAYCHVAQKVVRVPPVDVVIAGFVCKSVSSENNERELFADCIRQAAGKTGETFAGVLGYVKRFQPALVVCENVEGLVKRNKGAEPVINHVRESFEAVNYGFGYRVLDTRDYLLPQRRHRCWMWAMRGAHSQPQAEQAGEDVVALSSKDAWSFSSLFKAVKARGVPMRRALNLRERRVVATAMGRVTLTSRRSQMIVDIAKSEGRAFCAGAAPCIVPNSRPYWVFRKAIFSPEQVHSVQGIFKEDFPALQKWAKEKPVLTRDLAGNAFSTTVCMAVLISCLSHLSGTRGSRAAASQKESGVPAPGTPPARSARSGALENATPPRTRGAKRRSASPAHTPSKRRRR